MNEKPEKLVVYKCPSCGGVLSYDPEWSQYSCESCRSLFDVERFRPKSSVRLRGLTCVECGAELVISDENVSFACPYCGNNEVVASRYEGEFAPDFIVPFKLGIGDAKRKYYAYAESKEYLPDGFIEKARIVSVEGAYIPFWLFSGDVEFVYYYLYGEGGRARRLGEATFTQVPADASIHMPNDMMDSLRTYDFGEKRPFSVDYMPGFVAERYTESHDESWKRVKGQVELGIEEAVRPESFGRACAGHCLVSLSDEGIEQVLLPVWLFAVEFKGKMYLAGVNGQTGDVATNFPVDRMKRFFGRDTRSMTAIVIGMSLFIAITLLLVFLCLNLIPPVWPLFGLFPLIVYLLSRPFSAFASMMSSIDKDMKNVHDAESACDFIDKDSIIYEQTGTRRF